MPRDPFCRESAALVGLRVGSVLTGASARDTCNGEVFEFIEEHSLL